jgi:hypothetical protein
MTPSRIGLIAVMLVGVRPQHLLRFVADGLDLRVGRVEGDDRRLAQHDAAPAREHARVRGSKVDRQVIRENCQRSEQHEASLFRSKWRWF